MASNTAYLSDSDKKRTDHHETKHDGDELGTPVEDLFDFLDSDDEQNIKFNSATTPGLVHVINGCGSNTSSAQSPVPNPAATRTLNLNFSAPPSRVKALHSSMRLDNIISSLLDIKSYIANQAKASEFERLIDLTLTKFSDLQSENFNLMQQINTLEKENDKLFARLHAKHNKQPHKILQTEQDAEDDAFANVTLNALDTDTSVILVDYWNEKSKEVHRQSAAQSKRKSSCSSMIAPWTKFYKRHKQGIGESLRIAMISSEKLNNAEFHDDDYFMESLQSIEMKCYFPKIFQRLREIFGISWTDFMHSFKVNHLLEITQRQSSLSGSQFFYSFDGKYIIKSMRREEVTFIKQMIYKYCAHIEEHKNQSFLSKYIAMFKIADTAINDNNNGISNKVGNPFRHFIIMNCVFYDTECRNDPLLIYDLKGSKYNRITEKRTNNLEPLDDHSNMAMLKDYDWMDTQTKLDVVDEEAKKIRAQIHKDIQFLKSLEIMDYSLLIALYDDGSNARYKQHHHLHHHYHDNSNGNKVHGHAMARAEHKKYFVGIIDFLQHFTFWKQVEGNGAYYLLGIDGYDIVDPEHYAARLYKFVCDFVV